MKKVFLLLSFVNAVGFAAWSQEELDAAAITADSGMSEPTAETSRDPASDIPGRKTNEEELRVLNHLPDAQQKRDTRSMQNEVYKSIYNRELKPDQREDVLDE